MGPTDTGTSTESVHDSADTFIIPPRPNPSADAGLAILPPSSEDCDTAPPSPNSLDVFTLTPVTALKLLCAGIEALVRITGDIPPTPPTTHSTPPNMRGMQAEKENIARSNSYTNFASLHPRTESSSSGGSDDVDGVSFRKPRSGIPEIAPTQPYIIIGDNAEPLNVQHSAITRKFYSKQPPPISLEDYLMRLHKFCPMSTAVYLATSFYIHKLAVEERAIPVTRRNCHRLLLAGLRVAMKALEDLSYPHSRFSKVGGIPQVKMPLPFPRLYLMHYGFENETTKLHDLEREIGLDSVVYNVGETNIFVGMVSMPRRAVMELKALKVFTEPVKVDTENIEDAAPPAKKQKTAHKYTDNRDVVSVDSDTASEDDADGDVVDVKEVAAKSASLRARDSRTPAHQDEINAIDTVKVLKLSWATDSMKAGKLLPMDKYIVYTGIRVQKPPARSSQPAKKMVPAENPLTRARADSPPPSSFSQGYRHAGGSSHSQSHKRHAPLLRAETTTEHDAADSLPDLPEYSKKEYCCQRPTPSPTPNDPFIAQLKKILLARKLISDEIGVRAYNKAIATIAAYPYTITTVAEIQRLPGCGPKYLALYQEWKDTGRIREVEEFEQSEKMQVLNLFYGIHDVGGKTANQFYDYGWRDLDDVVSQGWDIIERNQQVGVKWYDEFQTKIPRVEVQRIGNVVLAYANKIREGFQMVICGGYRRGKKLCGDVDIILTHPDEQATDHFVDDIVYDLAQDGWIQYTLSASNKNSERGQEPLNWKGGMPRSGGGFDSLDKALVVWQDPTFQDMDDPEAKNPNIHRRVDIIISPWKTAGCAIVGWSGANMFERDLRRYCREKLKYKFDSTGVRTLGDGTWVDLEGDETDLLAKEKKVFEGLGLEWIEPTLRCTDG
ncbi:DNA polymerase type-X family pol4 [Hyphodiscus hymeniophilus]|uniref:DNA-directed DNA polymerase n=1 Tax=Hyphodiscus hymeniophilus TaxID=353542 RepID=A0A9P7AV93_9HELO|nr:DNA polymerase type-X family pol4 [Hyphodiscus hymeniophilus]